MILAWELDSLIKLGKKKLLAAVYWLLFALSFFFFYPLWTGIPIANNLLKYWFWLPTWK
jgi:dolichyl-phosphate-mannose--protein O-mannosyl transferase